jgi:hypothetical protein
MSDRKLNAKKEMLERMSSSLREDSNKDIGKTLGEKKLSKVTVMAPDKKSLAKGLSKAQELLKQKYGDLGMDEEEMEEADEEAEYEDCPKCDGLGCGACESEEEEDSEEEME